MALAYSGLKVPTRLTPDTVGIVDPYIYVDIVDYATNSWKPRLKISNNEQQTLWFRVKDKGGSPARYAVATTDLGSVANGGTTEFTNWDGIQVTAANAPGSGSIPSGGTLAETIHCRLEAYIDGGYLNSFGYVDFDITFTWIDSASAGWTVVADASGTTTGDGNAGGTTAIDSGRGEADDYWNGYRLKITSGACAGEERFILDWVQSTRTFTVAEAFSAQIVAGVAYKIHSGDFDGGTAQGWATAGGNQPSIIDSEQYKSPPYSYRCRGYHSATYTWWLKHYKPFAIGAVTRAFAVLYFRIETIGGSGEQETQIMVAGAVKFQFRVPSEAIWLKVVVPMPLNATSELRLQTYFDAVAWEDCRQWLDSVKVVQS